MDKVRLHRALTRVMLARIPKDCVCDLELLRDYIEESEPIKHAHWEYPYSDRDICRCSNCGFNVQDRINNVKEMFLACPRCFARMEVDDE